VRRPLAISGLLRASTPPHALRRPSVSAAGRPRRSTVHLLRTPLHDLRLGFPLPAEFRPVDATAARRRPSRGVLGPFLPPEPLNCSTSQAVVSTDLLMPLLLLLQFNFGVIQCSVLENSAIIMSSYPISHLLLMIIDELAQV
jgi:hypothetical protein